MNLVCFPAAASANLDPFSASIRTTEFQPITYLSFTADAPSGCLFAIRAPTRSLAPPILVISAYAYNDGTAVLIPRDACLFRAKRPDHERHLGMQWLLHFFRQEAQALSLAIFRRVYTAPHPKGSMDRIYLSSR